jgi:uncharacterized protein YbaR (Trm112 family)
MLNMTDDFLLLLRCPITRRRLVKVEAKVLDQINRQIHDGKLTNRLGEIVDDVLDDGLSDDSGKWIYWVRDGILCLVADEAISLCQFRTHDDVPNT